MINKIYIVLDVNPLSGLGHFMRGLAIWQMLKDFYYVTLFLEKQHFDFFKLLIPKNATLNLIEFENLDKKLSEFSKYDIFFFDGYIFDENFREKIKQFYFKKIFIDDFGKGKFDCAAVINHAEFKKSNFTLSNKTKVFLGFDYLMLRKSFFFNINKNEVNNNILITYGGTLNLHLKKTVYEVLKIDFIEKINILGHQFPINNVLFRKKISFYNNLKEKKLIAILKQCDIVICQSSTIALECFVMNKKMIIVKTAENQNLIYDSLKNEKNVIGYSNPNKINHKNIINDLEFLKNQEVHDRNVSYPDRNFLKLIDSI